MREEAEEELSRFLLLFSSGIMCVAGTTLFVYFVWSLMEFAGWYFGEATGAEPLLVVILSFFNLVCLPIWLHGKDVAAVNVSDFRRAALSASMLALLLLLIFAIFSGIHLFGLGFWFGAIVIVALPAICAAHIGYIPFYIHRRNRIMVG